MGSEYTGQLFHGTILRHDSSRLGRFMQPDPLAGTISNPQSLNRYAYVQNDPINLVDPLGLSVQPPAAPKGCLQWICHRLGSGKWSCTCKRWESPGFAGDSGGVSASSDVGLGGDGRGAEKLESLKDRDLTKTIKKRIEAALENRECAELLGGKGLAVGIVDKLNIVDATNPFLNRSNFNEKQQSKLHEAQRTGTAATRPFVGEPIFVGSKFMAASLNMQSIDIFDQLVLQAGKNPRALRAHPSDNASSPDPRFRANKIQDICFPKKAPDSVASN